MGMGLPLSNRDVSKKGSDEVAQEGISHCPHCTCGTLDWRGFQGMLKAQTITHSNLALGRADRVDQSTQRQPNSDAKSQSGDGRIPAFMEGRGTQT